MDMVVEEVVDKELTKVVEQVNKELVKESNEGLVKVYLWKVKKNYVRGSHGCGGGWGSWQEGDQGGGIGQQGVGQGGHGRFSSGM